MAIINRRQLVLIHTLRILKVIIVLVISAPGTLWAYGGPGVGLTVIGTVLALIAGVLFAIVGFIWYPIKRLLKIIKGRDAVTKDSSE